jgi:glycosyltransferase involved in cell wall biosynthesis
VPATAPVAGLSERAGRKVMVVMPALNAAGTLAATIDAIPPGWVDEMILVDDGSTDETIKLARSHGIHVIWHPHNVGYGGNQKTCYLEALQREADVVVMLHPDGQYEPQLIPDLIAPILDGQAEMVLGSRMREAGRARASGMPLYKVVANRVLTAIENRVMGTRLTDLHTGYRAYSKDLLLGIPFLRNSLDFSFDSEVLLQTSALGFRIAEVPARTRYSEEVSSIGFWPATVYGLKTLWMSARLVMHRTRLWPSRKFRK